MKKQYEKIEIEIAQIQVNDVIATSSPFDGEEQPFANKSGARIFVI